MKSAIHNHTWIKVASQVRDNTVMIEGEVFTVVNNQPCRDKGFHCLTVSKAGFTGTLCRDFPSDKEFATIAWSE